MLNQLQVNISLQNTLLKLFAFCNENVFNDVYQSIKQTYIFALHQQNQHTHTNAQTYTNIVGFADFSGARNLSNFILMLKDGYFQGLQGAPYQRTLATAFLTYLLVVSRN